MANDNLNTLPASVKPGDEAAYLAHVDHLTGRSLPVIIDAPGDYRTRNGLRVAIDAIYPPDTSTFNCKGHLLIPPRIPGGRVKRVFQIWQQNGRFMAVGETGNDVVEKIR